VNDNERIAMWMGWKPGETCCYQPDTDILRWHGKDALLQKIEEKGLILQLLRHIVDGQGNFCTIKECDLWGLLRSTPAQLTAALVAVIKDES